eukprot:COSAG01_NODE_33141_length_569_cov_1.614894_2_plen_79_part_00
MAARLQLLLQAHETAGIHSAGGSYIDFGIGCGLPARLMAIGVLAVDEQQHLLDRGKISISRVYREKFADINIGGDQLY